MAKRDRLERLKTMLKMTNGMAVKDIAAALDVTEMTVRRDLKILSDQGDAVVVRGVAVYRPKAVSIEALPYSIEDEKNVMKDEKERIGKAAASLLSNGDVVFLDVGTTVECMAANIGKNMQITAMCFAANTMMEVLKKNISQLIMGGGYYHPSSQVFESEAMMPIMNGLRATKAFIAPAAMDRELGLMCSERYDKEIKKLEIRNSKERIILATSNKFDKIMSTAFSSWSDVDKVITDSGITKEWLDFFKESGIGVIVV
ncbi:MAG: DeoR/GlpR family DNA-binding transcription regulator [Candidatus Ornithospirochaeta sp.]